ncbi:hypothetical protein HDV01_001973 [Terramyces sp. JEL0728]|nr:hypothetical protein HDV01_001973 [Terramyces sp. JEL0728]
MILELPLELQLKILNDIEGIDLLHLSITNKYYYKLLAIFQRIASWLKSTNVWPSLTFIPQQEVQLKPTDYQLFKKSRFKFQFIELEFHNYMRLKEYFRTGDFRLVTANHSTIYKEMDLTLLKKEPNLKSIQFHLGRVLPEQIANLLKLNTLHTVSFYHCRINDEKLVELMPAFTRIKHLDLYMNCITSVGATFLAKMLPNTKLQTLNLCRNMIDAVGLRNLSQILHKTSITDFNITENIFSNRDWYILYSNIANTSIHSLRVKINTIQAFEALTRNIRQSKVKNIIVESDAEYLPGLLLGCTNLQLESMVFDGYRAPFTDTSAAVLSEFISKLPINTLELTYCKVETELVNLFTSIAQSRVQNLKLEGVQCKDFTEIGRLILKSKLRSLSLVSPLMDDSSLCTLLADIKQSNLQSLDLSRNTFSEQGVLFFVSGLKYSKLRMLKISFKKSILPKIRRLVFGTDFVVRLQD